MRTLSMKEAALESMNRWYAMKGEAVVVEGERFKPTLVVDNGKVVKLERSERA